MKYDIWDGQTDIHTDRVRGMMVRPELKWSMCIHLEVSWINMRSIFLSRKTWEQMFCNFGDFCISVNTRRNKGSL